MFYLPTEQNSSDISQETPSKSRSRRKSLFRPLESGEAEINANIRNSQQNEELKTCFDTLVYLQRHQYSKPFLERDESSDPNQLYILEIKDNLLNQKYTDWNSFMSDMSSMFSYPQKNLPSDHSMNILAATLEHVFKTKFIKNMKKLNIDVTKLIENKDVNERRLRSNREASTRYLRYEDIPMNPRRSSARIDKNLKEKNEKMKEKEKEKEEKENEKVKDKDKKSRDKKKSKKASNLLKKKKR